jgi:hypothetical protein
MKALKDQAVQDDSANNDKENDGKPNENNGSSGKLFPPRSIGGIFRIRIQVSLSLRFSDFEFRSCLVLPWVRWWKVHHFFAFFLSVKNRTSFTCRPAESATLRIAICYTFI